MHFADPSMIHKSSRKNLYTREFWKEQMSTFHANHIVCTFVVDLNCDLRTWIAQLSADFLQPFWRLNQKTERWYQRYILHPGTFIILSFPLLKWNVRYKRFQIWCCDCALQLINIDPNQLECGRKGWCGLHVTKATVKLMQYVHLKFHIFIHPLLIWSHLIQTVHSP